MSRGFRVNFEVPELARALDQIGAYDGKSRIGIEDAIRNSTKAIKAGAKYRAPRSSGALRKAISSRVAVNKYGRGGIEGYVSARKPYAHLVEFGARAVTIVPKNKKAMTLAASGGAAYGLNEFAAKVDVPTRAEHPFMRPAFEAEKPALIRAIAEAVKP